MVGGGEEALEGRGGWSRFVVFVIPVVLREVHRIAKHRFGEAQVFLGITGGGGGCIGEGGSSIFTSHSGSPHYSARKICFPCNCSALGQELLATKFQPKKLQI